MNNETAWYEEQAKALGANMEHAFIYELEGMTLEERANMLWSLLQMWADLKNFVDMLMEYDSRLEDVGGNITHRKYNIGWDAEG